MQIDVKQINSAQLSSFVINATSGSNFNSLIQAYGAISGYYGPHVMYNTGGAQLVTTQFTFNTVQLTVSGNNPSGVAQLNQVNAEISGRLNAYSGHATGAFARTTLNNTFTASNTFTSDVFVPIPSNTGHAINLLFMRNVSGVLQSGINNVTISDVAYLGTSQKFTGQKTFDISPLVVTPTNGSGAVPLSMLTGLSVTTAVSRTGINESISGIKTFVQSPIVPVAVGSNQAINKAQLDAGLANVAVGTGSIQGVTNVNGISGSVILEGQNGITIEVCSGIIYVSGNAASTNLYSVSIPLTSGITGISFNYATGFSIKPNVVGTLEYAGQGALSFVNDTIFNSTTGGFNVAFSTGIPSSGYYYNFDAIPVSGSGFFSIKGDRGFPATNLKPKGQWRAGLAYDAYSVVYLPNTFTTYFNTGFHISDSFNAPSGTGTSFWNILASGAQGPTGYLIWKGTHNTGVIYNQRDAVVFDGSSYVYTGSSPVSGFTPESLTGNWGLVAAKAPLGYFINSGQITGNFTNLSFYLSPVATGLDLAESFVTRTFYYTGFALGAVTTGTSATNGGILTGRIYQRETNNNKIILQTFTFGSGQFFKRSGDFSFIITGDNRIGVDITNTLNNIDKFSVGIYGFGT